MTFYESKGIHRRVSIMLSDVGDHRSNANRSNDGETYAGANRLQVIQRGSPHRKERRKIHKNMSQV